MAAAAAGLLPSCPRRLLTLLSLTALFRGAVTIGLQSLYCGPNQYGSVYAGNVDNLLSKLPADAIADGSISLTEFADSGTGDPDGVGGVAMCYADHSRKECGQCLTEVADRIRTGEDCPNSRNASAFYDTCLLRYFQLLPQQGLTIAPVITQRMGLDLTGNEVADSFQQQRDWLLQSLTTRAVSSKLSAAADTTKYGYGSAAGSIYGLVQCDQSRSEYECTYCLNNMILLVQTDPSLAYKTVETATAPAAPPPPTHQGRSHKTRRNAIIIVCCIIALVVAGIIVLLWWLFPGRIFHPLHPQPRRQSAELGSSLPRQFSPNQLKAATNNFSHPLGSGAFGVVYKGILEGKEVAVKKLRDKDGVEATDFANEAGILMAIKHINLVNLLGYCNAGKDRMLCFEYISGGSLDKLIHGNAPQGHAGVDCSGRYKIVQGICSGLQYLHHERDHEQKIVHMDLKASEGGEITCVKIADFGLSKFFKADLTHSYTELVVGLKAYMAPEYLNKGRISPKADIYSFGVLILEIVTGRCAMVDDSSSGDFIAWVRSEWSKGDVRTLMDPAYLRDCQGDCMAQARNCVEIALDCIQEEPDSRPEAEKIKQRLSQV